MSEYFEAEYNPEARRARKIREAQRTAEKLLRILSKGE